MAQQTTQSSYIIYCSKQWTGHLNIFYIFMNGEHMKWTTASIRQRNYVTRQSATVSGRAIQSRWPTVRPVLTPAHHAACLAWAQCHLIWTRQQWLAVFFIDESCFARSLHDGQICIWGWRRALPLWWNVIATVVDPSWCWVGWMQPTEFPSSWRKAT